MANEKRERYSELINAYVRAKLVTVDTGAYPVFNTRYEGSPKAGAVKIPVRSEIALQDYDTVNGVTPTVGDTSFITVAVNKDKVVNEIIDGFDAVSVPANLVADRLESAAYKLVQTLDTDGIAALIAGGTTVEVDTPSTAADIYSRVVALSTTLTANGIPQDGRYLIVSPSVYGLLLQDTTNFIRQSDLSQGITESGYIGQVAGFNVKTSNQITGDTELVAGHPNWATRIQEWKYEPKLVDIDGDARYVGASEVKGRIVYAHAVTNANAILVQKIEA